MTWSVKAGAQATQVIRELDRFDKQESLS